MKRIPRIKFPQRHPKSSTSGIESQTKAPSEKTSTQKHSATKSDVPNTTPNSLGGVGGKASIQPKRAPVSDKEMEAILLGGCI